MTAPNPEQGIQCISNALKSSGVQSNEVDLISGHLTSTIADPVEVQSWVTALNRDGTRFPYINSLKSMTGHMIGAAGAVETIAAVLQLHFGFIHPSLNCPDPHSKIIELISPSCIPQKTIDHAKLNKAVKLSLGFGDVNSCVVLSKF